MKVDQPLLGIVEDDQHVDVLPATAATAARSACQLLGGIDKCV